MKCYRYLILKGSLQGKEKGCLLCGASKRRAGKKMASLAR